MKAMPVSEAQHLCSIDYETKMAFIAVTGERESEMIVGSSMYALDHATNMAEVNYMIRPEWQSMGLGSALQKRLAEYAASKGVRGFTAEVFSENIKMVALIKQVSDKVNIRFSGGSIEVVAHF